MNKVVCILKSILGLIFFLVSSAVLAAENSLPGKILSIESRSIGAHAIFFSGTVPDQGCTLKDRAIIDDTWANNDAEAKAKAGAKTLISVALAALAMDKDVIIQVEYCTPIDNGGVTKAPKITKILVSK